MPSFQVINSEVFFHCLSSCLVHHYEWTEQAIAKVLISPHILGLDSSCFGSVPPSLQADRRLDDSVLAQLVAIY